MRDGRSVLEILLDLIDRRRGAVVGIVAGILVALLFFIFGFWKMVGIAICILIGYFIGKQFDNGGSLDALRGRLFGKR
jgi:uncharacterized membrane protein